MGRRVLYIIGGPAQVGKSTITKKMMERNPTMKELHTDNIRDTVKSVIRYGPSQIASGSTAELTICLPSGDRFTRKFTRNDNDENSYGWLGILEFINSYDQKNDSDVIAEGVAITPELIKGLKLNNLVVRPVFIGYSKESHAKSISDHVKREREKHYIWREENGDPTKIDEHAKRTVLSEISESAKRKKLADDYGYKYFDVTEYPSFEEYLQAVMDYLLKNSPILSP